MPDKIYKLDSPELQAPIRYNKVAAIKIEFQRPYLTNPETGGPDPVNGEIQVWLSKTRAEADGTQKSEPKTPGVYTVLGGASYTALKPQLDALEDALYALLETGGHIDPGVVENA